MNRAAIVYAGLIAVTGVWIVMIFAAPWLWAEGQGIAALTLYQGFSAVCHQMPERSFHLFGHPLGVCARCAGIYMGFAAGLMLYPFVRDLRETTFPDRRILLLAAAPLLIDFAGGYAGLFSTTFLSRAATGIIAGAVASFYIVPGFVGALHGESRNAER